MTSRMKVAAAALLCLLAAGAAYGWLQFWPTHKVQEQVRRLLKDPDSAHFEAVSYFRATGAGCGLVNARNSMGGYAGLTRFLAYPDGDVEFQPSADMNSGSTDDRLSATREHLRFLEKVEQYCPDPKKPKT